MGAVNFDQLGIQAAQGVIFILVSENAFFPMYATLALIPQELPLLRREYRAGIYPIYLYYIARIFSLVSKKMFIVSIIKYMILNFLIIPRNNLKNECITDTWFNNRAAIVYGDSILVSWIARQYRNFWIYFTCSSTYHKCIDCMW